MCCHTFYGQVFTKISHEEKTSVKIILKMSITITPVVKVQLPNHDLEMLVHYKTGVVASENMI